MGNGACCSGYTKNEEDKLESIQPLSSKRILHKLAEESEEIEFKVKLDSEIYLEKEGRPKEKAEFWQEYEAEKRESMRKVLAKDRKGVRKVVRVVRKRDLEGDQYLEYVKNVMSVGGDEVLKNDAVFEDKFAVYVVSEIREEPELLEFFANSGKISEKQVSEYVFKTISYLSQLSIPVSINPFESSLEKLDIISPVPEIFRPPEGDSTFPSEKSLVWTLGVLIFIILCGKTPFKPSENPTFLDKIFDFTGKNWNSISAAAKSLIMKMLTVNQDKRPGLSEVLNDIWLKKPGKTNLNSKSLEDFLAICRLNGAKSEIITFCKDFQEKIEFLQSSTEENYPGILAEVDLLCGNDDENYSDSIEAFKSLQKQLLYVLISNFLNEIKSGPIIAPEIANSLLAELGNFESELIENNITASDYCDFLISFLIS